MVGHVLDRPAWSALTTRHAGVAEGGDRARRYDPSIVPFCASRDDEPESVEELGSLLRDGESMAFLQADPIRLPGSLTATLRTSGVQMIAARPMERVEDERIRQLGPTDAKDMLALAALTRPGPFTLRALDIGRFWGIREGGRLIAMAGERMAQPGWVELSGVCSHPEARGRGLARLVSLYVAGRIGERGDKPFLHAFADNVAAIRLYEQIGFELRSMMDVALVQRAAG